MATGVSGYFDVSGTNGAALRVYYQETYDTATNKSAVEITRIRFKSSAWYGVTYYLSGTVKVAGSTAVSMSSSSGTHSARNGSLNSWADITGSLGSVSGITHNDDGTKSVSIAVSVRGYTTSGNYGSGWSVSGSKTVTLTPIARKSTLTAANGTLGTAQTLTINRQSSGFYHSIRYACGDVDQAIVTKTGDTSISFTPSLNLAKQNKTGTSVSITFTLYTFDSNADDATEIGRTTKTISCTIPASVKPSCSIGVTDVNGHVATFGGYVQGQSDIEVVITGTMAQDSPISDYTTTADGKTYKTADFEIAPISGSGTVAINATVKDRRGRKGTATKSITVLPYSVPAISLLSVRRCNSDGTEDQGGAYVKVTYSFNITSLSSKNGKTITLKYKKTSDSSYTSVTLTSAYSASSATTTFAADTESSYDVVLVVTDSFGSVERSTAVSTAYAFMDWDYGKKTFSLGKIAEKTSSFECGWTQYDKFGTLQGNGLAAYKDANGNQLDPDISIEPLILTNSENNPISGRFFYIYTVFYATKSETANRAQIAIPYQSDANVYHRYYNNSDGAWSAWKKTVNESEFVTSAGTEDPDTTKKRCILTKTNTPMGSGYYMYIHTMFNGDPASATCRTQVAVPYQRIGSMYHRYYTGSAWSDWRRHVNADESFFTMTKVWENASPTSSFAAQTITVDLSDADFCVIIYDGSPGDSNYDSVMVPIGTTTWLKTFWNYRHVRSVKVNANSVVFNNSYSGNYSASVSTNSGASCIPIKILKVKGVG